VLFKKRKLLAEDLIFAAWLLVEIMNQQDFHRAADRRCVLRRESLSRLGIGRFALGHRGAVCDWFIIG
jgi:hypothetical protein